MKIKVENTLVELTPETDDEKEQLLGLWKVVVDCVEFNKKLAPIGEYIPAKENIARFNIE